MAKRKKKTMNTFDFHSDNGFLFLCVSALPILLSTYIITSAPLPTVQEPPSLPDPRFHIINASRQQDLGRMAASSLENEVFKVDQVVNAQRRAAQNSVIVYRDGFEEHAMQVKKHFGPCDISLKYKPEQKIDVLLSLGLDATTCIE